MVGPWIRGQTLQTSSGGSCWMAELAQMSCSSTSQLISCWQMETVCSRQRWDQPRWTWAVWSKMDCLVSTRRWNLLWVANATTAETFPMWTKRYRAVEGPPPAPTEPGNLTEPRQSNRAQVKRVKWVLRWYTAEVHSSLLQSGLSSQKAVSLQAGLSLDQMFSG